MRSEVYWINGPWRGRMAIVPRPRGGDWLEDELRSLRLAGIEVLVSLLTDPEIMEWQLDREQVLCEVNGLEYLALPISDRGVPQADESFRSVLRRLEKALTNGKNIAMHCRAGIGRSALLAACLLVLSGVDSEAAFRRIGEARGCLVPDTTEQREWVAKFGQALSAARSDR
ncbi:MAG TPA: dual specificity protein phosphatase family protein [Gemmataceae bacterium]|nr:dual specificity protein phosphatase family protein [Gemmataceae bacterium]